MPVKVVDFFSGCGGTSAGLRAAGLEIILGLDEDRDAARTFQRNFPEAAFVEANICHLSTESLEPHLAGNAGHPLLFSGCVPCQPFSMQNTVRNKDEDQRSLLFEFFRFIEYYLPQFVFVENVPRLGQIMAKGNRKMIAVFIGLLDSLGYHVAWDVLRAQDYGVPQRRRRLVLMASLNQRIDLPTKTHGPGTTHPEYSAVWDWIGHLPAIEAGEEHPIVPNHRAARLSELNLRRIQATPVGGGRRDWPQELHLECHSKSYRGHTDVYGRMHKDRPASGLTTRCVSLSNGRFGHPEQHRAISVREAAFIQTFPDSFSFHGNLNSMARQIGNAVPPLVVQSVGKQFLRSMETVDNVELA